MNYFAHGMRFIDRTYFLAGTAVPDWLTVADRRVRLRDKWVVPFADANGSIQAEVAAGILQHMEDDRWFHSTAAFYETTGALTRLFRELLGSEDGYRPSFLGHIAAEMILDGILIENNPGRIEAYYATLARLDPHQVQSAVNQMVREPTSLLAPLIPRFREEQFLRDYVDPVMLLRRLNQVMRRVGLKLLPEETADILPEARRVVREQSSRLMSEF